MIPWTLRRARPEEASRLSEIAHAAKRYWGYPEHWIRAWRRDLTLTPARVAACLVFVACREGDSAEGAPAAGSELAAFYALAPGEEAWSLEHLWVDPPHIGLGLGSRLLRHAASTARERGARRIEIVSDPNAAGFYERLGARRVGDHRGDPLDGQPRLLPIYLLEL